MKRVLDYAEKNIAPDITSQTFPRCKPLFQKKYNTFRKNQNTSHTMEHDSCTSKISGTTAPLDGAIPQTDAKPNEATISKSESFQPKSFGVTNQFNYCSYETFSNAEDVMLF